MNYINKAFIYRPGFELEPTEAQENQATEKYTVIFIKSVKKERKEENLWSLETQ